MAVDLKQIADNLIKGKAPEVKALVQKAALDIKVTIMIGGAPVTQSYADEIGAQGYAPDAASAVDSAKELLEID